MTNPVIAPGSGATLTACVKAATCQLAQTGPLPVQSSLDDLAALALITGAMGWHLPRPRKYFAATAAPLSKCGLPGCGTMSRKDYCCADHCRKHKELRKPCK